MNKPEWMIILFGCIMCAMNGAIQTVLTILIGVTVGVSGSTEREHCKDILSIL
jgi:hypothetical protein